MMRSIALLLMMFTAAPIGGCAHRAVNSCDGFQAIYLDQADRLTLSTEKQIVAHNEYGERQCGWKPAQ